MYDRHSYEDGISGNFGLVSEFAGGRIEIPLTLHIASIAGVPVTSHAQIARSVAKANEELARFGIHVHVARTETLSEGYAQILRSDDRIRLAGLSHKNGTIHVFMVEKVSLYNPRSTDNRVSGMHWRYHGILSDLRRREYVVVAQDAPSTTLVHELGHAFGLSHERLDSNLMCSCRRTDDASFTGEQGRELRKGARTFLRRS